MSKSLKNIDESTQALAAVMAGIIALLIVIGISRFGYGPLISSIVESGDFSHLQAGLIAAANLAGYLAGCLYMGSKSHQGYNLHALNGYVLLSVLSLAALYLSASFPAWILLRFFNGFAGGVVFIIVSVYLTGVVRASGRANLAPVMYSGVGAGILLSTFSVFDVSFSTHTSLVIQVALCVFFYLLLLLISRLIGPGPMQQKDYAGLWGNSNALIALVALSYLLEGMGYILYITFIFPYLQSSLLIPEAAVGIWLLLGAGALLGPVIVGFAVSRVAVLDIIIGLFVIQVTSILMTLMADHALIINVSTFGFGLSFMGLTSAFIFYVRHKWQDIISLASVITIAYSVGQAVGPVLGGYANAIHQGYRFSIILSVLFVLVSLMLLLIVAGLERREGRYALRKY